MIPKIYPTQSIFSRTYQLFYVSVPLINLVSVMNSLLVKPESKVFLCFPHCSRKMFQSFKLTFNSPLIQLNYHIQCKPNNKVRLKTKFRVKNSQVPASSPFDMCKLRVDKTGTFQNS